MNGQGKCLIGLKYCCWRLLFRQCKKWGKRVGSHPSTMVNSHSFSDDSEIHFKIYGGKNFSSWIEMSGPWLFSQNFSHTNCSTNDWLLLVLETEWLSSFVWFFVLPLFEFSQCLNVVCVLCHVLLVCPFRDCLAPLRWLLCTPIRSWVSRFVCCGAAWLLGPTPPQHTLGLNESLSAAFLKPWWWSVHRKTLI